MKEPEDKWSYMVKSPEKNWPEDYHLENGNYQNVCIGCGEIFMGHKMRQLCRECDSKVLTQGMNLKLGIGNL